MQATHGPLESNPSKPLSWTRTGTSPSDVIAVPLKQYAQVMCGKCREPIGAARLAVDPNACFCAWCSSGLRRT